MPISIIVLGALVRIGVPFEIAGPLGLIFWAGFVVYHSVFADWLRSSQRSVSLPTVPEGIEAPPGRGFAVEFVAVTSSVHDAKVSLTLAGAPDLLLRSPPRPRFHLEGALIDREAREALESIFDEFRASKIECRAGLLTVTVPAERLTRFHSTESYNVLLRYLAVAARALERVPLAVKVLGGERRAIAGAHGAARCSYCHGELTGSEPDLVACGSCSTVLHEGCWAEHGRCPVLGCRGAVPERGRSRS